MTGNAINTFWEKLTAFRATLTEPEQQLLDALVEAASGSPTPDVQGYCFQPDNPAPSGPSGWGYARWAERRTGS